MLAIGLLGAIMVAIVLVVYGSYFFFILKNKKTIGAYTASITGTQNTAAVNHNLNDNPNVSIIVSTFNEENVIERKIKDISKLNYPANKMEILVYDDSSSDMTQMIAEKAIKESGLDGTVIRSVSRLGLNRSINVAVAKAKHNIVCITDSDVLLEKDALKNAVVVLKKFEHAGGVTGHILPVFEGEGVAQNTESSYRDFYHTSMLAESSIHSAFPGNGPLIVYDKSQVPSPIPLDYGSTDGNIAMNIIRNGYRFLYVPNAIVYEPSPENLKQHRLQKVRRAKRLLQVFLKNRDVALNSQFGSFGRMIFPLKLLMFALCPTLIFVGFALIALFVILSNDLLLQALTGIVLTGLLTLTLVFKRVGRITSSFVLHQFYLIVGLLTSIRKSVYWKTIERKTKLNF